MTPKCCCIEVKGDNPRCPIHVWCVNCNRLVTIGKNAVNTPNGPMCDSCADVVRNPRDGTIAVIHPACMYDDSLTDMEKA